MMTTRGAVVSALLVRWLPVTSVSATSTPSPAKRAPVVQPALRAATTRRSASVVPATKVSEGVIVAAASLSIVASAAATLLVAAPAAAAVSWRLSLALTLLLARSLAALVRQLHSKRLSVGSLR